MNRDEKAKEVEFLKSTFKTAKGVVFAKNEGLTVEEVTKLRKRFAQEQIVMKVAKNRLTKRALKEIGIQGLDNLLNGPTTLTSSEVDAVTLAKILVEFVKEHEKLSLKGGFVDGSILSTEQVKNLAKLPSKEELYSMLLRCLMGPATGLAFVLSALPRQLVTVIDAIRKQKETK